MFTMFSSSVQAENVLDSLLTASNSSDSNSRTYLLPEVADRRLKQVQLLLKQEHNKKRQEQLAQLLRQLSEQAIKHQMPLKKWYLRRNRKLLLDRSSIVKQSKLTSDVIMREQNALNSLQQSHLQLVAVLQQYLKARKTLTKRLKERFTQKNRKRLKKLLDKVEKRLKTHEKRSKKSRALLLKLTRALNKNQKLLNKARRSLFAIPPLPPPAPRQQVKKPVVRKPTPRKRRRKRRSRRSRRKKARPVPKRPEPTMLTMAQQKKLERQQELQFTLEQHQSLLKRLGFTTLRHRQHLLQTQRDDERLHIEISQTYIDLFRYSIAEMKAAYVILKAQAEGGLLHFNPSPLDTTLMDRLNHRMFEVVDAGPTALQGFFTSFKTYMGAFTARLGWLAWVLIFALPIFFLFLGFGLRLILRQLMRWCELKARMNEEVARPWIVARTATEIVRDLVWYGLLLLGLVVVFRLVRVPTSWSGVAFSFAWILLLVRMAWTLANQLFGVNEEERLIPLEETTVTRLRRVLKGQSLFALFYLPLYQAAILLQFPKEFIHLLWLIWLSSLLLSLLLLAFRQKRTQTEAEKEQPAETLHPLQLWWGRLFPLFALLCLALFVLYGWGYRNLASYVGKSLLLSLVVLALGSSLYALLLAGFNWLLGKPGEAGHLGLSPRLSSLARRLSRVLVTLVSGFVLLSVLLEVWEVPGGIRLLYRLLNTPILNIQKTHLSVLSFVRFMAVFGFTIWFSGFVQQRLSRHIYPLLRLDPGTQHAINTTLGYLLLALGGLLGLRVMGMSIGVLAVFAGVIGIGVGFGMQNVANNFISGLIITFGRPIAVGHIIEVGDTTGVVRKISARSTTLETFDSRIILIPNSQIITNQVINWSLGPPYVVAVVNVGVAYGSDTEQVKQTLLEIARHHHGVLRTPMPNVRFTNFGDSTLDFELRVGINDLRAKFNLLSDLRFAINERFAELEIEISFPQQDIHFDPTMQQAITDMARTLSSGSTTN
jgi:small-conductance mechanosensitive channel